MPETTDRLQAISDIMDFMAWNRGQEQYKNCHPIAMDRWACLLGDMDSLEELHRLLYDND